MFYDKFNDEHKESGFKFLDEIYSQGHDNMHLAWQDLYVDCVKKSESIDMVSEEVEFNICKDWNYKRKGTSELKFLCSNIDFLIKFTRNQINFYNKEFGHGNEDVNEEVAQYRLDLVKLKNLSNIQEIQEAINAMLLSQQPHLR